MINCSKIDIITGHFGSGKTEFAINYSIQLDNKFKNCTSRFRYCESILEQQRKKIC